jgi:hypothetical protein
VTTNGLFPNSFSQIRKRGLMNRIRRSTTTLGLAALTVLAASGVAHAQETTGRVVGNVVDQTSGAALSGVTVIVQGPQGEDATITDEAGQYSFSSLPVGTYVIRYYLANTSTQVEQPGVKVSAEKTVRVNAKIATTAQAAAQQTYVITGKAPTVDVGSPRIGTSFDEDFTLHLAMNQDYGSVIAKAPGVFVDPSGNVSIGGATGLENIYVVNGVNVTGLRYGNLESGGATLGGGTNLPTEFLTQIDVNAGGYQAEFGGALGGVINTVLKSGSNQFHGSVFGSYAPHWLSADPRVVTTVGSSISAVRKPDFDDRLGFELGGPIVKDKLFFWLGMAPQIVDTHVHRFATAFDDDGMGRAALDANNNPVHSYPLTDATRRLNETHRIYSSAATLNFVPTPDHKLELAAFGTPSFNNQLRSFNNGNEINSEFPSGTNSTWAGESLTKTNTDVTAHWTSKLFDRHWQIEAIGALHNEYFYDRSADPALNASNQLQYNNTNLWDREQLAGCDPSMGRVCPVNPYYSTGGFGQVSKYNASRWSGELKASNFFELGGHNELKYGLHTDLAKLDLSRYYSGPQGARSLVFFNQFGVNSQNIFGLGSGQYPGDFFPGPNGEMSRFPQSDLVQSPLYKDELRANVKSLSNALFLQDTYSPSGLRNLSLNAGVRYEAQTMYDMKGVSFLSSNNLAPRFGAVFDPFNDGRSKISAGYGRFFEAVPLDIAARYFGGENYVTRQGFPASSCANSDIGTWTGAGEWRQCAIPAPGVATGDVAGGGYNIVNNTAQKQTHIQGQYQNEVVATAEREIMEDMTVRLDYTHRWIGQIIEDGYGPTFTDVLGNPGNVPQEALTDAMKNAATLHTNADSLAAMAAASPMDAALAAKAADANSQAINADNIYTALVGFKNAPKPERTYDALSLTLNKRFSKDWLVRGSYTYSRLVGNYQGLFQAEQGYYAPNGNNSYDTPDLMVNSRGLLPNDHPHQGKLDGFYSVDAGPGKFTFGLSFMARSGMPRNTMGNLFGGSNGNQIVFILPRGSAGRTPAITQFDTHIAYAQKLQKDVTLEAYIDLFNIFDQRATLLSDDNYTYDGVAPIVNGSAKDLLFAKTTDGVAIKDGVGYNKNFGHAIAYQAPFYTRLGLRLMF